MMKIILIGAFMMGLGLSPIALAKSVTKVQPGRMKCEDFVALDDNYKPALVFWAAGVDRLGVKETDELVMDTARPVALVVEECKKTPKASFMGKIKQLARSGKFNLYDHH
ncbi:acid stress chaperone HdeA [Paraburkholderia sp. UCT70]|uniref:HdeA/HdeB family chaperone n=1 Tax=Paraburkholderia sp. UCT70 TaxID=2991068 RepID=UPI003D1DF379